MPPLNATILGGEILRDIPDPQEALSVVHNILINRDCRNRFLSIFAQGHETNRERRLLNDDCTRLSRLLDILSNKDRTEQLINVFQDTERLQRFLTILRIPPQLDHVLLHLTTARSYLATQIRNMPVSPTARTVHVSGAENVGFNDDRYLFLDMWESDKDRCLESFFLAVDDLDETEGPLFYEHETFRMYASLEGDVRAFCVINIICPVIVVLNALLKRWHRVKGISLRYIVGLRSEVPLNSINIVDHALVLFDVTKPPRQRGRVLVMFEEKVVNSMFPQWEDCIIGNLGQNMEIVANNHTVVRKMLPQIRKYVFVAKTVYIMASDSANYAAMIWDRPSSWSSGKQAPLCGIYAHDKHRVGATHGCKIWLVKSLQGIREHYQTPRELLAFQCWLALRDVELNVNGQTTYLMT